MIDASSLDRERLPATPELTTPSPLSPSSAPSTPAPSTPGPSTPGPSTPPSPSPPPPLAALLFGDRLPLAVRYVEWLATAAVERGLIGPRETGRLWDRHLFNCVAVAALIPPGSSVVDIGSGAGLPGIVVAIARPDLRVTLVEPMLRRTAFLDEVVTDLALDRVEVRRARAEELTKPRLEADVVSARAVVSIDRLAALAVPLLRGGGRLLALKGSSVVEEVTAGWADIRRVGMADEAALFAVRPATHGSSAGIGDPSRLRGLEVVQRAAWRPDGSMLGAGDAAETLTHDDDTLALILHLRRSTQLRRPTKLRRSTN